MHTQGYWKYLRNLAMQPTDSWQGFYVTPNDSMNFGLRFQIAFAGYSIFAFARNTPAYRAPYATALQSLIERMAAPQTWAYWLNGVAHNLPTVEITPTELPTTRLPYDPCEQGNIQYSAHLASLMGFYQMLTDDKRYNDSGLTLQSHLKGYNFEFHYTYSSLAAHIHEQMQHNFYGGVCCEPGRAYAACNNHCCISNVLHDQLYGTRYAEANERWANWVENRMLTGGLKGGLPLPAPNGLLSVAYMPDLRMAMPVSFNLTDAWGLAFMAAWKPSTVEKIYERFRRRLKKGPNNSLYLSSVGANQTLEISSVALNTAFAALLAREMGDQEIYERIKSWADQTLEPTADPTAGDYYKAAMPTAYVTALFALADVLPASGGGLHSLITWRPEFNTPYLAKVNPDLEVRHAVYKDQTLEIKFAHKKNIATTLEFGNCPPPSQICFNGNPYEIDKTDYDATTHRLKFSLPDDVTEVMIRF